MLTAALDCPRIFAFFHPRMEDAERDFRGVPGNRLGHLEQLLLQFGCGQTNFPRLWIAQLIHDEFEVCEIALRHQLELRGVVGPRHQIHVRALAAAQRRAAFQRRNFRKSDPNLLVHIGEFYAGARS